MMRQAQYLKSWHTGEEVNAKVSSCEAQCDGACEKGSAQVQ